MNYHFFDYKWNIAGFHSDLFCTAHLVYICLVFLLAPLVSYALRNVKREKIANTLKILFFLVAILEVAKISWESYYDVTTGQGFNAGGILPFYSCSLFIFTLPFAAWGKGKAKEIALAFLCTLGLLFGGIGVVYCNGLNYYPFWTFGAFYSLFFHTTMFATGVFLLRSGYKTLDWDDALKALVPVLALALIAIPIDYILKTDYMMIWSGSGVPFYEDLAAWLASKGLRPVYTAVMMITHIPLAMIVVGGYKAFAGIILRSSERKPAEEEKKVGIR